jgi:hypothetical protein
MTSCGGVGDVPDLAVEPALEHGAVTAATFRPSLLSLEHFVDLARFRKARYMSFYREESIDMALQLGALRDALIEAGASVEKAEKAAEELAAYENRFAGFEGRLVALLGDVSLLKWMVGLVIAIVLVEFGMLSRVVAHT